MISGPKPKLVSDRFWSKVKIGNPDECWEWQGYIRPNGYGLFYTHRRPVLSHRFAYFLANDDKAEGLCICHSCDNRACCNPNHLWKGTNIDNMQDMVNKKRSTYGEKNPNAKLTQEQVNEIRELYASGKYYQHELSKRFGICAVHVSRIVTGAKW